MIIMYVYKNISTKEIIMKKKIFAFLLVLASVIACTVCIAACSAATKEDYVGEYEFVSYKLTQIIDGEKDEEIIEVGKVTSGGEIATKYSFYLKLKENGDFEFSNGGSYIGEYDDDRKGTWTVEDGKLKLNYYANLQSFTEAKLSGSTLTFTNSEEAVEDGVSLKVTGTLKLKKVAE